MTTAISESVESLVDRLVASALHLPDDEYQKSQFNKYMAKDEILDLMKTLGVDTVVLDFSGGGDSGDVQSISLMRGSVVVLDLLAAVGSAESGKAEIDEGNTYEKLIESLSKPIFDQYSFDGEPGVDGKLTWYVADGTLNMTGSEYHTMSYSVDRDLEYPSGETYRDDSESPY